MVGSLNNPSTHSRAIDLISSGRLRTDDVVSDRLPLDELAIAMNLDNFANPGKIAIELPRAERTSMSKTDGSVDG